MTKTRKRATLPLLQKVPMQTVLIQLLLTGCCALALMLVGLDQAQAALLAGVCVCLPGVFVAWHFSRQAPAAVSGEPAAANKAPAAASRESAAVNETAAGADEALVGEGKTIGAAMAGLIATIALMGLVFAFLKPPALGFFSTLAITQVAPLIAATLQDRRRAKARRH